MDVAGIILELRSVQKGIAEGILILERSQPVPIRQKQRHAPSAGSKINGRKPPQSVRLEAVRRPGVEKLANE
jgi:hypothetical protein